MFEVLDSFEDRQQDSKYKPVSDGRIYRVSTKEMGHRSPKNLSMALRSFGKRRNLDVKIQTGDDYVLVRMTPKF